MGIGKCSGQVELSIAFDVPSGLVGLSGLNDYATKIVSVDVVGGTADYVLLNLTGSFFASKSCRVRFST